MSKATVKVVNFSSSQSHLSGRFVYNKLMSFEEEQNFVKGNTTLPRPTFTLFTGSVVKISIPSYPASIKFNSMPLLEPYRAEVALANYISSPGQILGRTLQCGLSFFWGPTRTDLASKRRQLAKASSISWSAARKCLLVLSRRKLKTFA